MVGQAEHWAALLGLLHVSVQVEWQKAKGVHSVPSSSNPSGQSLTQLAISG